MKTLGILVEGLTEETFVKRVLRPHFNSYDIEPYVVLATTKRVKHGQDFKGGITTYQKLRNDLLRLLAQSDKIAVTMMIDFYGPGNDFPGKSSIASRDNPYSKVKKVENAIKKDINHPNFIPYLQLHEFEALLFSQVDEIVRTFKIEGTSDFKKLKKNFENIVSHFNTPEEINDNPTTCPSKRIKQYIANYRKPLNGPTIAQGIGLGTIRDRCPHFNDWITKLESL